MAVHHGTHQREMQAISGDQEKFMAWIHNCIINPTEYGHYCNTMQIGNPDDMETRENAFLIICLPERPIGQCAQSMETQEMLI